ncbi:hypothetical protein B0O80DRAFT_431351 [Mortierella sp. GBAus27b]|nr:hypothetical protein B0O80DRAFT_431351 [Mortierella sp. GBAus27b]
MFGLLALIALLRSPMEADASTTTENAFDDSMPLTRHHTSRAMAHVTQQATFAPHRTVVRPSSSGPLSSLLESTLVIAFPDVLQAGPKILLSPASASTNGTSVASWIHYFKKQSTSRKAKSSKATSDDQKIRHSTTTLSDQKGVSLLTIVAAPPTTEQASHLCEAIANRARTSGTSKIILVAASNFAAC